MPVKKISVVIIAYNRKNYIMQAVSSVLNQTLDKAFYEIIVVKNFIDATIDDFLKKNGVKNIYNKDERQGKQWIVGINESDGDVISFLDDDDISDKNRMSRVYEIFNKYNIQYYRNSYINIDDKGAIIHSNELRNFDKLIYYEHSFEIPITTLSNIVNSSGTSVKKALLLKYAGTLELLYISGDRFINELCYLEDVGAFYDSEKLTYYRVHRSSSHVIAQNVDAYLQSNLFVTERSISDHRLILQFCKGTKLYELIYYYLLVLENHIYVIKKMMRRLSMAEYKYLFVHAYKYKLYFDWIETLIGFFGVFGYRFRSKLLYRFNNLLISRFN